jgi:cytochrome c biogenesis protein CcdA
MKVLILPTPYSGFHYRRSREYIMIRNLRNSLNPTKAIGIGAVVSFIEFGCTGQIYLSSIIYSIIYMIETQPTIHWFGLLLLYNIFFVLPLLALLYLIYSGVKVQSVNRVFKQNLRLIKLLYSVAAITHARRAEFIINNEC